MTLNDLTLDWQPVATRVRVDADNDGWAWLLPEGEVSVFHMAFEGGSVLKATRGRELVAKLRRVNP